MHRDRHLFWLTHPIHSWCGMGCGRGLGSSDGLWHAQLSRAASAVPDIVIDYNRVDGDLQLTETMPGLEQGEEQCPWGFQ